MTKLDVTSVDKLQVVLDEIEKEFEHPMSSERAQHLEMLRVLYEIAIAIQNLTQAYVINR